MDPTKLDTLGKNLNVIFNFLVGSLVSLTSDKMFL